MKVYKVENGKLMMGEVKDVRKNVGNCPYCGEPVYVSSGQAIVYRNKEPTHKKCRK